MPLTRPVVGADISAADFGQPVYDWIVANTASAWIILTYSGGASDFGGGRPPTRCRKRGDMVDLQIACKGQPNGGALAILPAGYRPAYTVDLLGRDGAGAGIFNILPDGSIVWYGTNSTMGILTASIPTT